MIPVAHGNKEDIMSTPISITPELARKLPRKMEVRYLLEKYGVPDEDRFFSHEELEEVIGRDRKKDAAYYQIIKLWKGILLFQFNVDLTSCHRRGYVCSNPNVRIEDSSIRASKAQDNLLHQAGTRAGRTRRSGLSKANKAVQDYWVSICNGVSKLMQVTARDLGPYPTPTQRGNPLAIEEE